MKIAVASDLHLEFRDLVLENTGDAEVLVLAGDICMAKYADKVKPWFEDVSKKFNHVVYVVGNHEHYHNKFHKTVEQLKDMVPDNVHVLDNETFELDGKVFIGSTLWTSMNDEDPLTMMITKHGMMDFKHITYWHGGDNYWKFTPEQSVKEYKRNLDYIQHVLYNCKDKDCVVVTHHSPSFKSVAYEYRNEKEMNGAYHNNLDWLMTLAENIRVWIHGHTHTPFNYTIGISNVICNPRGYPSERTFDNFKLVYREI